MVVKEGSDAVSLNPTVMELKGDRYVLCVRGDLRADGRRCRSGGPGILVTVTFDESDGTTHLVSHSLCPSKDVRDTIIASGMESGMRVTMDQLEELVASLQ